MHSMKLIVRLAKHAQHEAHSNTSKACHSGSGLQVNRRQYRQCVLFLSCNISLNLVQTKIEPNMHNILVMLWLPCEL